MDSDTVEMELCAKCAVENCVTILGAPRDRNGFCERCADELEAIERDERESEVG